MLTGKSTRTLPIIIYGFIGQFKIEWNLLSSSGIIAALPAILLFIAIQKQFVKGLASGSVKG
jgi:ABC-type sugar transport system, permease component